MGGLSFKKIVFATAFMLLLSVPDSEANSGRRTSKRGRVMEGSLWPWRMKGKYFHASHHHHHRRRTGGKSNTPYPPPVTPPPQTPNSVVYNVLDFGAKGDGITDDTKAFLGAWVAACREEASVVEVPAKYVFLVGPISFSGPDCQPNIVFQICFGSVLFPIAVRWDNYCSDEFEPVGFRAFTVARVHEARWVKDQGSGTIDGSGDVWWQSFPFDDDPLDDQSKLIFPELPKRHSSLMSSLKGGMPNIKPTALRFYGSFNVSVSGITIERSPHCHLKFDNCIGVTVHDILVTSPGDSPNTDGIHLQNSKDVLIHSSTIACGDDCVSIQTGCSNVFIDNMKCGPGHGISIGGLGRDNTKACVSNVTISNISMYNTMNGVRIKTWQGGSGSAQGIRFSNIQVSEVQLPIVIDQFYCDKAICKNQSSAVALTGINFENTHGTYTVKPVHLACSDGTPCVDINLRNVHLIPLQEKYHLYDPFCWQTFGHIYSPMVPSVECLQIGKPSSNKIQAHDELCEL